MRRRANRVSIPLKPNLQVSREPRPLTLGFSSCRATPWSDAGGPATPGEPMGMCQRLPKLRVQLGGGIMCRPKVCHGRVCLPGSRAGQLAALGLPREWSAVIARCRLRRRQQSRCGMPRGRHRVADRDTAGRINLRLATISCLAAQHDAQERRWGWRRIGRAVPFGGTPCHGARPASQSAGRSGRNARVRTMS